jgi:predicted lipoprotein with Yx(FWY)xxD motif
MTTAVGAASTTEIATSAAMTGVGATTAPEASAAAGTAVIPATGGEATINVATDPKLGQILVDGKGMTLYVFLKDAPDQSNCTGSCAQTWPPLLTQGNPTIGQGVDTSMVGGAALADGSKIATYNKMPLYYFSKDTKPGDTNGQGIGGVWYVISPSGQPVK